MADVLVVAAIWLALLALAVAIRTAGSRAPAAAPAPGFTGMPAPPRQRTSRWTVIGGPGSGAFARLGVGDPVRVRASPRSRKLLGLVSSGPEVSGGTGGRSGRPRPA